ncbi:hypothetical protein ACFVGN_08900 [Streptomyces sp. NPDC057757]|uniref:hypothetical protein n=1 Tax=Streptomyces sp. NPDC057757 TaxID=3346241 RepID=UPI0036C71C17
MIFFQLVGAAVEFGTVQLAQSKLGFAGLVLLTLALVGIRTGQPRLAGWAALLFFLLTLQLQS